MKITVEYTIDHVECEATIKEEGRPDEHVLDVTVGELMARVQEYIRRRLGEEQIPD